MKHTPLFLALSALVFAFVFSGCGYEACQPYNLDTCTFELAKNVPLRKDHFFCSCRHNEATENLPYGTDVAGFGHYDVSGYEDVLEIVKHYEDYFKSQGYSTEVAYGPKKMFSSMMDRENHFDESELEGLFDDKTFGQYYLYFYKDGQMTRVTLDFTEYESQLYATMSNDGQFAIFPEDSDERIQLTEKLGNAYASLVKDPAAASPVERELSGSDTAVVFYVNGASERFLPLVTQTIPQKKFHIQYYNYLSGPDMKELATVNSTDFKLITDAFREADLLAVYFREDMKQPIKTGSGYDRYTNQPVDYYLDGYEKGKMYLIDTKDGALVKVVDVDATGIYDFKSDEHYESDYKMDGVCAEKLKSMLTGYPGVKLLDWGKNYYFHYQVVAGR